MPVELEAPRIRHRLAAVRTGKSDAESTEWKLSAGWGSRLLREKARRLHLEAVLQRGVTRRADAPTAFESCTIRACRNRRRGSERVHEDRGDMPRPMRRAASNATSSASSSGMPAAQSMIVRVADVHGIPSTWLGVPVGNVNARPRWTCTSAPGLRRRTDRGTVTCRSRVRQPSSRRSVAAVRCEVRASSPSQRHAASRALPTPLEECPRSGKRRETCDASGPA